jgi:hypothetical protein
LNAKSVTNIIGAVLFFSWNTAERILKELNNMYEICKQCTREFGVVTRPWVGHVRFGVSFLKGRRDFSLF